PSWFHRSRSGDGDGDEAEDEKAFLVPSVVAFPHGMSTIVAGLSLAEAKKEEFSKSSSTFATTSPAPGPVSAPHKDCSGLVESWRCSAAPAVEESIKFGSYSRTRSTCVYGGAPKGPQIRDLRG
ncbi:hypothetical protein ACJX0J_024074, partial [Zea mays]